MTTTEPPRSPDPSRGSSSGARPAPVLEARALVKVFEPRGLGGPRLLAPRSGARGSAADAEGRVAVGGVELALEGGEVLGLAGESGCGKSTLARLLVRLLEPTSGSVWSRGHELTGLSSRELQPWRRKIQLVFQDPLASLSPRLTIEAALTEVLLFHGLVQRGGERARARELLELVGLDGALGRRYPHELSGGQRQRVAIARALAVEPEVLVADEPVSALDVSVRALVLNLLMDLKERLGLAILLISHDLAVLEVVADRVLIMRAGRVVEELPGEALRSARDPYTRRLLDAIPRLGRPAP